MVKRHNEKRTGPRIQIGKLGTIRIKTPITKRGESVMMPIELADS